MQRERYVTHMHEHTHLLIRIHTRARGGSPQLQPPLLLGKSWEQRWLTVTDRRGFAGGGVLRDFAQYLKRKKCHFNDDIMTNRWKCLVSLMQRCSIAAAISWSRQSVDVLV